MKGALLLVLLMAVIDTGGDYGEAAIKIFIAENWNSFLDNEIVISSF